MRCGDGRGHVGDRGGRSAGHGDGVDVVDSRRDVDSGIVRLVLLSEGGYEEREEEDDNLLEGAHLVDCCGWCCDEVFVVMRLVGTRGVLLSTIAMAQLS